MRRQARRLAAVALFPVLAFPVFGQIVGVVENTGLRTGVSAPGCPANGQAEVPVRIQPYTAELKTTTVQVLANGATITRESTEVRAADSQHRTLNSQTQAQFAADQPAFTWSNVNDPVENTQANWDSRTKTARVIKLPPESERHGCWATDSGNMRTNYGPVSPGDAAAARQRMSAMISARANRAPNPKMEDLGTTTIEGVETHGQRITTVIPAGQIGNDRELTTTTESWVAPSLGFELRRVSDDPQSGKTTMEVTHLDLSEPPLATFQPPEGYEVTVEEMHQVPCESMQGSGIGVIRHITQ